MPPARTRKPLSAQHAAFGRAIEELRRESEITQEELADRMGTTFSRIGLLERGAVDFRFSTQLRLAAALELEPTELLRRYQGIAAGSAE